MVSIFISLLAPLSIYVFYCYQCSKGKGKRLPGPLPLPLLGNVLQLPRKKIWVKLAELGKVYGRHCYPPFKPV